MSSQAVFTTMQERIAFRAGWDRTTGNWSTDRNNFFELVKKDALSRFENAHNWSFLYTSAALELTPSYATGTVGIASGVVTLASGTWPTWAAQGDLWIEDDSETRRYSVNTRDSNSQITLDDTTVAVASATVYSLKRHWYDLPSNFGGTLDRGFAFRRDSIYWGQLIDKVGHADFQRIDHEFYDRWGAPRYFLLQAVSSGATWRVSFTPLVNDAVFLDYRYRVVATDVDSGDTPVGGAVHSETILASFDYSAALHLRQPDAEQLYAVYIRKLEESLRYDRSNFRPIDYGPGRHGESYYDWEHERHCHGSIDDATFSFS